MFQMSRDIEKYLEISQRHLPQNTFHTDPSIRATRSHRRAPPNGWRLGSQIILCETRSPDQSKQTTCKALVYLVVYPSLVHFITQKYARTLHKRRPCDARTNAPRTTQPQASRLVRSGVRTCTHKDASVCMLHPLKEKASTVATTPFSRSSRPRPHGRGCRCWGVGWGGGEVARRCLAHAIVCGRGE